jgi:hypothetical protein
MSEQIHDSAFLVSDAGQRKPSPKFGVKQLCSDWRLAERDFQQRQLLQHRHRREGRHSIISMSVRSACWATRAADVLDKITPADISDPQDVNPAG